MPQIAPILAALIFSLFEKHNRKINFMDMETWNLTKLPFWDCLLTMVIF